MGWAGPPKEAQTVPMKKPTQHLIAEVPRKRAKGRADDRHRPWRRMEPLLHPQPGRRSGRSMPLQNHGEGDREVVRARASFPGGDGGRCSLELDQRTAWAARPRGDCGERTRAASGLAQRPQERRCGWGEAGSLRSSRSWDSTAYLSPHGRAAVVDPISWNFGHIKWNRCPYKLKLVAP